MYYLSAVFSKVRKGVIYIDPLIGLCTNEQVVSEASTVLYFTSNCCVRVTGKDSKIVFLSMKDDVDLERKVVTSIGNITNL